MAEAPVEVSMHVPAAPEDVFPYFTDPARYVQWMGSEAELEPAPGGGVPHPHARRVRGRW